MGRAANLRIGWPSLGPGVDLANLGQVIPDGLVWDE